MQEKIMPKAKSIAPSPGVRRPTLSLQEARSRAAAALPQVDHAITWEQLKERMPELSLPSFMTRENAGHLVARVRKPIDKAVDEISAARHRVESVMNQRAEKAITRFNDYMMVIFDA